MITRDEIKKLEVAYAEEVIVKKRSESLSVVDTAYETYKTRINKRDEAMRTADAQLPTVYKSIEEKIISAAKTGSVRKVTWYANGNDFAETQLLVKLIQLFTMDGFLCYITDNTLNVEW